MNRKNSPSTIFPTRRISLAAEVFGLLLPAFLFRPATAAALDAFDHTNRIYDGASPSRSLDSYRQADNAAANWDVASSLRDHKQKVEFEQNVGVSASADGSVKIDQDAYRRMTPSGQAAVRKAAAESGDKTTINTINSWGTGMDVLTKDRSGGPTFLVNMSVVPSDHGALVKASDIKPVEGTMQSATPRPARFEKTAPVQQRPVVAEKKSAPSGTKPEAGEKLGPLPSYPAKQSPNSKVTSAQAENAGFVANTQLQSPHDPVPASNRFQRPAAQKEEFQALPNYPARTASNAGAISPQPNIAPGFVQKPRLGSAQQPISPQQPAARAPMVVGFQPNVALSRPNESAPVVRNQPVNTVVQPRPVLQPGQVRSDRVRIDSEPGPDRVSLNPTVR